MRILLLTFITSLSFAVNASAEMSTAQKNAYAKAKFELIFILKKAEPHKPVPNHKRKPIMEAIDELIKFRKETGETLLPEKTVFKYCSRFFDIANTFSEKQLYSKCNDWGWRPDSDPSI